MENAKLELYWGSGSPVSWRALLALELKELPYTSTRLDLSAKDHRSEWFRALNPRGTFPLLTHGPHRIRDSLAILAYLDATFPERPLLGNHPKDVAGIWQWLGDHEGFLGPAAQTITRGIFRKAGVADPEAFERAVGVARAELGQLEERLRDHPWLWGDAPTAAEAIYYPTVHRLLRASTREAAAPWSMRISPINVHFPSVGSWLDRLADRPGIADTYPPHWRPGPS